MKGTRFVRSVAILAAFSVSFGVLTAFGGTGPGPRATARLQNQGSPVKGGTLKRAISEEPDQLDPARTIELLAGNFNGWIYDSLVYIGEGGKAQPWIAQSWTVSPDGKIFTFKIRPGVKFTDGTTLDAKAVKFSFDRILDPKTASPYKSFLGTMQKVDAPDPATAVFTFSAPYAPAFINSFTIGIVSPAGVQKYGDKFGHNPVGSGPFTLKEWQAGTKIVLARNPNYVNYRADDHNKGPAYVDQIEFDVISEAATQLDAFESGELDTLDVFGLASEDYQRISSDTDHYQIATLKKALDINYVEFANKPPYNNEHFRKAVAYAINRNAIIDAAYEGLASPNQCPVPAGNAAYDEKLCAEYGYSYDLNKAKQELAAAGWKDTNGNGIVEVDGKDLAITLWSYAPYPPQSKSIQVIQADLNKIGIKTDVKTIEFGAMQPKLESGEIGIDYMRWTFADQSIMSAMFKSPGWTKQTHDSELDKLLNVADTTVDPDKRLEASKAAETYMLQHAIMAPALTDWIVEATAKRVHDYHWDALANERLNDIWISK